MNRYDFATRLHDSRKAEHLSQRQLAELAGVSRESVQKWEKGEKNISLENADKLMKVLNTTLTIGGKNNE